MLGLGRFSNTQKAWDTERFDACLKQEVLALGVDGLLLTKATTQGGYIDQASLQVSLLSATRQKSELNIKVGIFFVEMVGGCNCHDDPARYNAYAELCISINTENGNAEIRLAHDE